MAKITIEVDGWGMAIFGDGLEMEYTLGGEDNVAPSKEEAILIGKALIKWGQSEENEQID